MIEDQLPEEEQPRSSRKWLFISLGGVLAIVGTVTGLYFAGLLPGVSADEPEEPQETVTEVFELEPLVVNLADREQIRYLRIGLSLGIFNPGGKAPLIDNQILLPKLKDYLLTTLGRKDASQLTLPETKNALKKELAEGINQMLGAAEGKVLEVYITEFIVQ